MGITLQHAVMLIREAQYRPLPETVYLIGRQTVYMTPEMALEAFRRCGFTPYPTAMELDSHTGVARAAKEHYISDSTFFKMLGAKSLQYIDVSDYENANIIVDLNKPIPEKYAGVADFIFGGSVCDNVFDPAAYISNISRLLSVGGRYVAQEVASNHYHPYVVLPHAWFLDYFVISRFEDAKIYLFEIMNQWNVYYLNPHPRFQAIPNFTAPPSHTLGTFIIAERGKDTTFGRFPTQDQYRPESEWAEYRESLARIAMSKRPVNRFRMPVLEQDLEMLQPRHISFFQYLGRFERYWEVSEPV